MPQQAQQNQKSMREMFIKSSFYMSTLCREEVQLGNILKTSVMMVYG